ncbi:MAG: hypothetical protein HOV81_19990 [Kofleriaceae bacterium]|nr:hypothetical protein [Kofleriaceae bacterium]
MRAFALAAVLAGCASAGQDAPVDGKVEIDARMIDAGPTTQTLSQTTSPTIKPQGSIACAVNTDNTTRANSYYRVFDLAAAGITTAFTVTKVSFQIEHCTPGATVAVRVGTYTGATGGTLDMAAMTILASNNTVAVPQVVEAPGPPPTTPGGTVDAPLSATIPAGSKLLVEVDAPDGNGVYSFFMGANDGGESQPAYIKAADCSVTAPTNISTAAGKTVNLLLTVTGQY